MMHIRDDAEFHQEILQSDRPALVEFYKGGCPTCVALEPHLDRLAEEYRGRATVAKFKSMTPFFQTTSKEIQQRYKVRFFPTVILFQDGEETERWVLRYNIADYRRALDEALDGPAGAEDHAAGVGGEGEILGACGIDGKCVLPPG